jgi:HK97 gp10 family phage protein
MSTTFDDRQLRAALARLRQQVVAAQDDAVMAGGQVLKQGMQERAAVLSGAMRDSVATTLTAPGVSSTGPTAPHSPYNEFGTAAMAAQPFVRPTADEDGDAAVAAVAAVLARAITG